MKFKKIVRDGQKILYEDLGGGLLRPVSSPDKILDSSFEDDLGVFSELLGKKPLQLAKPNSITVIFRDSDANPAPMVGGIVWLH